MPAPYLTEPDLRAALASQLQLAGGTADLGAFWEDILPGAWQSAISQINRVLAMRGLTDTDWDFADIERDLFLFWCGVKGGTGHIESFPNLEHLNRYQELLDITEQLVAVEEPPVDAPGPVGFGRLSEKEDFTRLGRVRDTRRPPSFYW